MKNILHSADGFLKYVLGFAGTIVFRLASRVTGLWNISPLMATQLSGSKAYGPWVGGLYGALNMVLLDMLTSNVGYSTLWTSLTYGLVGVFGAYFLRERKASAWNFIWVSVIGTLFFDGMTGPVMGHLVDHKAWMELIVGQIPFTLRSLASNIAFAWILAPWFYRQIMANPKWQVSSVVSRLAKLA